MRWLLIFVFLFAFSDALQLKRDRSNNVVIDNENRLMWMDGIENVKLMMSHKEAEPYCEELSYAGYSDWRLPHIDEFELIVDKKNERNYINRKFRYNQKAGYWAETAHFRTFWFYADYMHFISGTPYYDNRDKDKFVRCVRDIK